MDILMPVMDGLEATRAIRSMSNIPGSLEVPIVAMTANAFRKNFEESFRAGMNAHLVKPIEPVSFYRIITKLIGGRK
jgi:CheY-like chemotaxis protein